MRKVAQAGTNRKRPAAKTRQTARGIDGTPQDGHDATSESVTESLTVEKESPGLIS
jgi:hypothetical protein